jgi:hypothetical protein
MAARLLLKGDSKRSLQRLLRTCCSRQGDRGARVDEGWRSRSRCAGRRILRTCWASCWLQAVAGACFQTAGKGLFLCLERLGKAVEERIEGSVEREVVEDGEDQEDDHADQRTWGFGNAEEADETNFSQVDSGQGLLECAWVEQALGVDFGVRDEEDVVSVREVKECHADGRETKN